MGRFLFLILWCCMILICTCSASLENILEDGMIAFSWTGSPSYSGFFHPLPVSPTAAFLLRKLGHAFVFLILTAVLFSLKGHLTFAGVTAFLFAISTEILQLFFARDGRLFDVAIDSSGIILALILLAAVARTKMNTFHHLEE